MTHVPPPPSGPVSAPSPTPHHAYPSYPSRPGKGVAIAMAVLGLLVGGSVVWWWLYPPKPIDCTARLAMNSVSLLENGDVVALLGELETDDEIIQHIRKQKHGFLFDAENLYCLAKAGVSATVLREMLSPQPPDDSSAEPEEIAQVQPQPTGVLLTKGTPIVLRLQQEVHTKTISIGQSVPLEVAEPVLVDGVTVIAKGARAYAEVRHARRGRIMGKGAELALALTTVKAVDGQLLPLDVILSWAANSKDEAVAFAEGVDAEVREKYDRDNEIAEFSLGVFFRGKNVILPTGTHLTIYNPRSCRIRA